MDTTKQKLSTPCFILDEKELVRNISEFQSALETRFKCPVIGYSVKTNSLPAVLRLAKDHGCYAEVVSYHEYRLALRVGFDKRHIIYNGPLKTKETFLHAVQNGAMVNVECWREIEWLRDLPHDQRYGVGIRLNINISKVSPEDQASPEDDSRFGFSYESGDFDHAVSDILAIGNIDIIGIHTHREPQTRSVGFYERVITYVSYIIFHSNLNLKYWDLGGGFFGIMPGKPTYKQYVDGFFAALPKELQNIMIVVEPGNAIVASAFGYLMQVIDVKEHDGRYYVCTDGTRNDVDPFFHKSDYFKEFLLDDSKEHSLADNPQIVSGLSCLEYDRLFEMPKGSPKLSCGDRILFHRVGAYTMTLSPLFIHYFPKVYLQQEGRYSLLREEWGVDQFIANNIY